MWSSSLIFLLLLGMKNELKFDQRQRLGDSSSLLKSSQFCMTWRCLIIKTMCPKLQLELSSEGNLPSVCCLHFLQIIENIFCYICYVTVFHRSWRSHKLDIFWPNGIPVHSAWWCRVCICYIKFVIRRATITNVFHLSVGSQMRTMRTKKEKETKSLEDEGKHVKNWRLRAIFQTGNFYSSSGTTYVLF